ncbi:MAG: hypothetical protein WBJ42_07255 [Thermovirgaceae bacterium]|nr:hypothetical protein [Synergistales bacterium]HPC75778.1 hypothetical protein [Synergistales bacterium]HRS48531.1 hypothetical protein [Thermovirgaceae bacterium]HRU90706.1 hypothetical protein [Thermovirgaceae bacterium]
MFRVPLALTAFFFVSSMILGVMVSRSESRVPPSAFWGSLLLFLLFSTITLFFCAPLWVALAPMVPAAIFALLHLYPKKTGSDDPLKKRVKP